MFDNLTAREKIGLLLFGVILIVFIAVLIYPAANQKFNSATAKEYEPWDPENINVIKNKIAKLNEEGEEINQRITILPQLLDDVRGIKTYVSSLLFDTTDNYRGLLSSTSPRIILQDFYNTVYDDYDGVEPIKGSLFNRATSNINKIPNSIRSRAWTLHNLLLKEFNYRYVYSDDADSLLMISPQKIDRSIAERYFNDYKLAFSNQLKDADSAIVSRMETDKKRLNEINSDQEKLKDDFAKRNFNINQYAVIFGIPFFIVAALLMYWFGLRSSNRIGRGEKTMEVNRDNLRLGLSFTLNTITVLLLILSLLILGLSKVIAENALAALLGTIGGYVLNSNADKNVSSPTPPASPPPPAR